MKSYTDLEQSIKLAKFLPLESADMCINSTNPYYLFTEVKPLEGFDDSHDPCWSLAALMSVLPKIHDLRPIFDLEECSIIYSGIDIYITANNYVDACVEMILKLHELKKI